MEQMLTQLNEQQRAAVEYIDGPELVIAGAGSGKTRVLTYKIAYLISRGYEPWRIMALTFTNKAAREMQERIDKLLGASKAHDLWMGTFHSVFRRILIANARLIGFKPNFTIYDSSDSLSLIKLVIRDMGLDEKLYKPSTVASAISSAKNALVSPAEYASAKDIQEADASMKRPRLWEVYYRYMERCRTAGAMDFDDLLYYTFVLFRDNPEVLNNYREYFRYILVDEYQDTNFAQYRIVNMLASEHGKLCVVGDDAQSIYSFRGADINHILNMGNAFKELRMFKLERNYRSTSNIINAAGSLIKKNKGQIEKNVYSENGEGPKIDVMCCRSDREESVDVAAAIYRRYREEAESLEEFAILYRTNAQSRIFEDELRNRNIPYRIWGGTAFYQRKEVKDAVAYLRLIVNPDDDEALRRIINVPARQIGDTTVKGLVAAAIENGVSLWSIISKPDLYLGSMKPATLKRVGRFRAIMEPLIKKYSDNPYINPFELAREAIERSGLLAQFVSENTPENISRSENILELVNGVQQFTDESDPESPRTLADFLGQAALATDQDRDGGEQERLTLMTVHAAKGLEFKNVYIVGVEDDLFPSAMSKDTVQGFEEERRLMYVAITRAKNYCMLSYSRMRRHQGQVLFPRPSPFIYDISAKYVNLLYGSDAPAKPQNRWMPEITRPVPRRIPVLERDTPRAGTGRYTAHTLSELSEGMQIEHSRFGKGTVTSLVSSPEGDRIGVAFDEYDEKILLLRFAKFEIL